MDFPPQPVDYDQKLRKILEKVDALNDTTGKPLIRLLFRYMPPYKGRPEFRSYLYKKGVEKFYMHWYDEMARRWRESPATAWRHVDAAYEIRKYKQKLQQIIDAQPTTTTGSDVWLAISKLTEIMATMSAKQTAGLRHP